MTYKGKIKDDNFGYVAPFLGNGNMAFELDFEGAMQSQPDFDSIKSNSDLRIWWAGRRYLHKSDFDLVSFGCFGQYVKYKDGKEIVLKGFKQKLDTYNALSLTDCNYGNDINIKSEVFIHHNYNLIAVKKDFDKELEYVFEYFICDVKNKSELPELFTVTDFEISDDGIDIEYKIY